MTTEGAPDESQRENNLDKAQDMAIAGDSRRTSIEESKKDREDKLRRMEKSGWSMTEEELIRQEGDQEEIASIQEEVAGLVYDLQHLNLLPKSQDLQTIKAILDKYKFAK